MIHSAKIEGKTARRRRTICELVETWLLGPLCFSASSSLLRTRKSSCTLTVQLRTVSYVVDVGGAAFRFLRGQRNENPNPELKRRRSCNFANQRSNPRSTNPTSRREASSWKTQSKEQENCETKAKTKSVCTVCAKARHSR